ncbi:hypothetical protein EWM71_22560, partial [Salmonella enterica]|nr:hypothetical protein [Salmonella enterica]
DYQCRTFSRVINVTASAEKNRFLRLQPKPPVDEFLEIMKCETGFQNLSFGAKFCQRWQNQEGYNFTLQLHSR